MAVSYHFKGEDEELKGPFNEDVVLDQYKKAAFTSDVQFQIRHSESDSSTPFKTLACLIKENGHRNPFRNENKDIERLIELRQKEIEELSVIYERKAAMEKKLDELGKQMEEKMKKKGEEKSQLKTEKKVDDGGIGFRRQKHIEADAKQDFPPCDSCQLVFSSTKQLMMHTSKSSCNHKDSSEFSQDFKRWKKEDEQRLATGQRMYKKMSAMEIGSSRPQIDFIKELHSRIEKKMVFGYDENGKDIARTWIRTEEAKKVNDRFVKHLKEAKGNLVCTRCQVACRSHHHFLIHLITYDHRLKVKGSPIEMLSLLIGNFYKEKYLDMPDQCELDEDEEGHSSHQQLPRAVATKLVVYNEREENCKEEKGASLKQFLITDWSNKRAMFCCFCGITFSSYKQYLLHKTTEEHEERAIKADEGNDHFSQELLFRDELQKWRWDDRVKLLNGKRMYDSMNDGELRDALPSKEFTQEITKKLKDGIDKLKGLENHFGYLVLADYLKGKEGTELMKSLEDHLKNANKLVCRECKVAFNDSEKFFVHCQMSKHLINMMNDANRFISTLISMHKKDLYFN